MTTGLFATTVSSVRFKIRTMLLGVTATSVLLAFATTMVLPWYQELSTRISFSQFGAQVYTEPRGHYLFRQFAGDALTERAVYVHLDDPRITDDWLSKLRGLKHIEVLSIKSPNVTDGGLLHLRELPNLMTLNLVDTQVTESGVQALRKALPNLRLVHRK
jgi:hypothetical protein